ncbi:MAG TPA: HIT domain-containing protein [Candidatus Sulfopaludibacter sp.]|nr:HIT domain-containing protein [Candidatus Sulfopaludibacter sp.]
MDYLWTPWRYQYITTTGNAVDCVFCAAAQNPHDRETFIVHRAERNFVILNRFPYTSGHVMVVPYQHAAQLEDVSEETTAEMMSLSRAVVRHLKAVYHPEGLNLGMNLGKSAGAGIAGHLHLHILPRWTGDTNFMTTVGETRVLPEDLEETWKRIRASFQAG